MWRQTLPWMDSPCKENAEKLPGSLLWSQHDTAGDSTGKERSRLWRDPGRWCPSIKSRGRSISERPKQNAGSHEQHHHSVLKEGPLQRDRRHRTKKAAVGSESHPGYIVCPGQHGLQGDTLSPDKQTKNVREQKRREETYHWFYDYKPIQSWLAEKQ